MRVRSAYWIVASQGGAPPSGTDVDATLATLNLAEINPSISIQTNLVVNATLPTLNLTNLNTTVTALVNTNVSATTGNLNLTTYAIVTGKQAGS